MSVGDVYTVSAVNVPCKTAVVMAARFMDTRFRAPATLSGWKWKLIGHT